MATNSLLDVTTLFPAFNARSVKSRAAPTPPMVSTTTLTSGSCSMTEKSLTKQAAKGLSGKSRTSSTYFNEINSSAFLLIPAPLPVSTSATPEPTTPKPKIATFTIFSIPSFFDLIVPCCRRSPRQNLAPEDAFRPVEAGQKFLQAPFQARGLCVDRHHRASVDGDALIDG